MGNAAFLHLFKDSKLKVYRLYATVSVWVVPREQWYFLFTVGNAQEGL